jgi:hypothetical protein
MNADATGVDPYLDRSSAAAEITDRYFPVSPRGLRDWAAPVTITIGGRACARRSEWRAEAERRLREAQFQGDAGRAVRHAKMTRARAVLATERGTAA